MTDHALVLHRVLRAPRHLIYACWTQPEHMVHWFMPKPHFISDIEIDLRPGGRYNSTLNIDGTAYPSLGCVLDAIPDRRFAFTDILSENWQPIDAVELGFSATIDLDDHPDGTVYHVTARHRTAEVAARHEAMGFTEGWGLVATQLEAYAQSLAAR